MEENSSLENVQAVTPTQDVTDTQEKLSDEDMLALERANAKRQLSIANAKAAQAELEASELNWKNLVMTLFLKHGLSQNDSIDPATGLVKRVR